MSTTIMGQRLAMPLFCSPTALQRLFHHDGERAVAKAAEKFGTMFGVSSLGTVSIEEVGAAITTPKMFQLYFHKDRGLTSRMIERCLAANFDVLALTVDTIVGGNRARDPRPGFTSPPRLTLSSLLSFALHPAWTFNYVLRERFASARRPCARGNERCHLGWRIFQPHARSVHELARRRRGPRQMGQSVLPQGHHEHCRCEARSTSGQLA
jgi:isopentenyl diphosphate isomerase/L-lactate dehydrogenase-like FMN-dependent dehydrogenase